MKVYVVNLFLSRNGGGIFSVLKELYNSDFSVSFFKSKIRFIGYKDNYTEKDSKLLNGEVVCLEKENTFYYSKKLKIELKNADYNDTIVHLHTIWMYPSMLLSREKKIKKIISPHGMLDNWALNNGRWKKTLSLMLFEKKNLRTADCIHALCYQEYQDIRSLIKDTPIAIIPNGIKLPETDLYVEKTEKNILFLARLHPKKGLDNLIDGWSEMDTKEWCLWIVGPDEGNYEQKINEKNNSIDKTSKKIRFIAGAFGKDKEELYRSASLFILPSYSEGLPMTILEAWSYRLPVLMTKECNLEVGFEKHAAIQIDSSIEGIQNGLKEAFGLSKDEFEKMGENGYQLVKNEFTWEEVSKKMASLYEWVLNKGTKPSFVRLN